MSCAKCNGEEYAEINGVPYCRKCRIKYLNKRQMSYVLEIMLIGIIFRVADNVITNEESLLFLVVALLNLVFWGYFFFKDCLFGGRSIAKKMNGLKVIVAKTQAPCSWWRSIVRNIFLIPVLIEVIVMAVRKDAKRLGDLVAGTVVVEE